MCSPLPLRVWCMAAMAPALTEAATQAHIKLPLSPPSSTDCSLLNGRDKKPTIGAKEEFSSSVARSPVEKGFVKPTLSGLTYLQNVNGGLAKPVVGNTSVAATGGLVHLKVIRNLSKEPYHRSEFTTARKEGVNNSTNTRNQMNRQSSFSPRGSLPMNNINSKNSLTTTTTTTTANNTSNISSVCFSEYPQQRLQNSLSILASKLQRSHEGSSKTSSLIVNNMNTNAIDKPCNERIVSGSGRSIEGGLDLHTAQQQVDKFQCNLEKKANTLLKRLRRIQGRQLEHHIRHQLSGFVNKQHKNLQSMAKSIKSPGPSNVAVADLKTELLQSEDVRNLSTAALVNLVRKLQSSQPISIGHQRLIQNVSTKIDSNSVLKLDRTTCEESERVACQLNTALRHMESSLDSDATESSSGGESSDECEFGEVDTEKKIQDMPLHRRSEWKWAAERSSIASRWTWLQAQVSDLEYRIRQQSDTHRQIRNEKGDLVFESLQTQPVTCISRTGEILNQEEKSGEKKTEKSNKPLVFQSSKFNQSLVNCILPPGLASPVSSGKDTCQSSTQKSLNGLIDNNHNGKSVSTSDVASPTVQTEDKLLLDNSESLATPAVPVDVTCQAARCRPVKSYRKRKLFRTAGLHQLYRKATRLSTIKCHCYTPVVPCAMCGGRYNNTQSLDPDLMPLHERLSLLDPSFHPVLSFSQEIPLPVHFEALLKSGEWQNKPSPKPTKSTNERRRQKLLQNEARRTSKKLKNAAAVLLSSAKFRSRYDKKPVQKSRPPSTSPVSLTMTTQSATSSSLPTTPQNKVTDKRLCRTEIKKRRAAQLAIALKKLPSRSLSLGGSRLAGKRRFRMTSESSGLKDASSAMNFPSYTFKEMKEATLRKRRGESAFDINNIVIPYSMAASTRVEKLQYKEIVTPKWREIGEDSSESKTETEGIDTSVKSPCTTIKEAISGKTNGIIVPAHITEESEDEAETHDDDDDDDELPIEDLTDELYIQRHAKCEIQEKKRFVSYFQHGRRSNRSVRLDDSDPISPESVSLMDSNSMVGSPTHTLASSRHGNESLHSVASQSPPLPPLLQLQVQSPSQSVTNPTLHKHPSMQSVTESRSFLASLDDTSDELKQLENQQNMLDKSSLHRDEGDINNRHQQSLLTSCQSASDSKRQSLEQTLLKSEGTEHSHQMLAGYKLLPATLAIHNSSKLTPPQAFPLDSCLQTRPSTPTTYSAGQLQRYNDEQIGRRRSSSVSRTDRFSYDDENMTISHEMFEHLCVEPWVPRTFPLSEEDFEKLHVGNSSVEVQKNPSTTSPEISQAELATPGSSHPCSPLPSSSSASTTEDDPNDPEWKVIGSKSGIVLRLAKR